MAIETLEDRRAMMDENDFAVPVYIAGVIEFYGQLERPFVSSFSIEGNAIELLCISDDVNEVSYGSQLVINDKTYIVRGVEAQLNTTRFALEVQ